MVLQTCKAFADEGDVLNARKQHLVKVALKNSQGVFCSIACEQHFVKTALSPFEVFVGKELLGAHENNTLFRWFRNVLSCYAHVTCAEDICLWAHMLHKQCVCRCAHVVHACCMLPFRQAHFSWKCNSAYYIQIIMMIFNIYIYIYIYFCICIYICMKKRYVCDISTLPQT